MVSKTKITQRTKKKTNLELVRTINLAKKKNLLDIAKKLSIPTRQRPCLNVSDLDELKDEHIIICGKILGEGEIHKKMKVSALSFSSQAKEKLKKAGCEIKTIKQEIEHGAKGVRVI